MELVHFWLLVQPGVRIIRRMTMVNEGPVIARLFYRELAPPAAQEHLILSFWEFTVRGDDPAPIAHEIFPDGCISLVYRRNRRFGITGLGTSGLHLRSIVTPVFADDIYWGLRLSPAAGAQILRTDPAHVVQHNWDGDDEGEEYGIFDRQLLAELDNCATLEDAAAVFSHRLDWFNIDRDQVDAQVLAAVALIEESRGEIRIAAIADELELSVRQFERRFKASAGLTPKQYSRARRLRAAAVILAGNEPVNWAERAAEMGFADQAHLTHEFSAITGRTPRSLAQKVKAIDHGNLE